MPVSALYLPIYLPHRTLQFSEQASTAVRYGPGTMRGREGCITNDPYGADTIAGRMAGAAVFARRSQ
jgi:hypothetical protein